MERLALLEKDFEEVKKKGARPALLSKMEKKISWLWMEEHRPIDNDKFEIMAKKATDEIEKRFINGTIDFIKEHVRSLYERINRTWERLDKVWIAGRNGNATIEEFREVLEEWYLLHIKAIKIQIRIIEDANEE